MKITCMMRVRNEARWLQEVLESIHPLTEDILIFDDHSTDATVEIAEAMRADVIHSPFPDGATDEVRDKNFLLGVVRQQNPDYVLAIDGDEVLEAGAAERIRSRLDPRFAVYGFHIRYVWDDRQHYRADGVYGNYQRASMFSLVEQGHLEFRGMGAGCNFHCGNVPVGLTGAGATVSPDLLHLGYMHREDRVRKFAWYNERDPNNAYEDGYKHMVIGDLPEYPPDTRRLHGGPLKLFTLPATCWPSTSPACWPSTSPGGIPVSSGT